MCLQGAAKPEEVEEVVIKDQEADFAEVHSLVKSYAMMALMIGYN